MTKSEIVNKMTKLIEAKRVIDGLDEIMDADLVPGIRTRDIVINRLDKQLVRLSEDMQRAS